MARTTPNMALHVWDLSSDFFDHTQLAGNWDSVDRHDHGTNGGATLGANTVTGTQVVSTTLRDAHLTVGTRVPIGAVIQWWRPNISTALPTGWVLCAGGTLTAGNHGFTGGGTITLPDLRNKFILGADSNTAIGTAGTVGNAAGNAPGLQGVGGDSSTKSFDHTSHTHTYGVNSHHHSYTQFDHTHAVPSHAHSFSSGTDVPSGALWEWTQFSASGLSTAPGSSAFWSIYDTGAASNTPFLATSVQGAVNTSGASAPSANAGYNTTDVQSAASSPTGNANSSLAYSYNNIPNYYGLIYLMKVLYT